MGRRLKLNKEIIDAFCEARSVGSPYVLCAQYAGISYESFNSWRNIAEKERERIESGEKPAPDKKVYLQFLQELEEAEANAGVTWQQVIDNAARTTPQWAAYMLERWYRDEYKPPVQQSEVTGKDGGAIKHEDVGLTDAQRLDRIADIFNRARDRRDNQASSND